ncbi:hypothetical protein OKW30_008186 [Paraburkholderia sp. Clong3]
MIRVSQDRHQKIGDVSSAAILNTSERRAWPHSGYPRRFRRLCSSHVLSLSQAPAMHIHFPQERPEYCARDLVVAFPAEVDGERVQCAITAEALEDHFGAPSLREDDLIEAFDTHRLPIEAAARNLLKEVGAKPVMMHSGYFRFRD